jgi:hypothetical protein
MRDGVLAFAVSTGAGKLSVTAQVFDYAARKRSFKILAHEVVKPARSPAGTSGRHIPLLLHGAIGGHHGVRHDAQNNLVAGSA